MKRRTLFALVAVLAVSMGVLAPAGAGTDTTKAATPGEATAICDPLFGTAFGVPNSEPLGPCQWNMAAINAGDQPDVADSYMKATGAGVTVGVIDSGVDINHPDIAPNLDLAASCSFIFDDTPTAGPGEIANGDCSNNGAVQDLNGHGTHVASTVAAPINGIGIAGVAPEATIVSLKACTKDGYCFADSVAAALRYAGDIQLDVVNLSLFADPYLYYCKSDAEQRAILKEIEDAARYAQQQGVTIVAAAGNEASDLQHPTIDEISPDWPPGSAETREVQNNCRVAPAELPGVITVSSVGPASLADYSSVGMSVVDVTAPGGDYFSATGTVQDAILAAWSSTDESGTWEFFDFLADNVFPGLAVLDGGARYVYLNGTSMASPHAAGVAALVKQMHPNWKSGAIGAAVTRSTQSVACPDDGSELRCYGNEGRTSYFGHGLVDASAAADQ